jgi:hypothetical protein
MKKTITVITLLLLSGCAIDTGVVPLSNNVFTITKQAGTGFSGIEGVKEGVLQEANRYCGNQNKKLKVISSEQTQPPYILGNFPRADMRFSCENNSAK